MTVVIYAALMKGRTARATRALRVLPSMARAVLRIDPAALRRSSAARTLLDTFVDEAELGGIEATCGLDPIADLAEVTIWVRGSERQPLQSFGLMLTGARVDAVQIAECYEKLVEVRGGSVTRLEATTGPLLASDDRGSAIALVDDRTVITGSVRTVAEAVAVRRGLLPTLAERSPIASMWPTVSSGAAIAAALDPPSHWKAALERITTFGASASALHGIDGIGLAVRPGPSQAAEVYLDAGTSELAAQSAKLVRGWATAPPEAVEPPWDALLRSAKVAVHGRHVLVRVDVSSLVADR
jgi:hypothetical protein